jgi:hypothetical protein
MPYDLIAPRHTQLFELLRQKTLSETTAARVRARGFGRAEMDRSDAAMLCALAVNSWNSATA